MNNTKTTRTISIPSPEANAKFADSLSGLAEKARAYGKGDSRRIVAVEEDLVKSLKSARNQAMSEGLHAPTVDSLLSKVIVNYENQIEGEWA